MSVSSVKPGSRDVVLVASGDSRITANQRCWPPEDRPPDDLAERIAIGAFVAAKARGRENEMKFVGIDGLPGLDGGRQAVATGSSR
jgi:hypothetical protein